jgi:transcriptional regulator with XRE-family HTH domain
MAELTSGTALVDELVDGVRIGDNLVFQGDASAPLDLLVERFVARASAERPLVRVNLTAPWSGPVPDGVTVLDWSPVLSGVPSELPGGLAPDATLADALAALVEADERVGAGATFAFDRMTAVQAAWGEDAPLELFLTACPRLYRRRSLALWTVEIEQHRPAFLRRLAEITQVVVELTDDDGRLRLTVREADGRGAGVVGRTLHAEVVAGDLRATDAAISSPRRLGTVIRDQRLLGGLAQAELARRVGISPSALSQIERGVRGPSGDTLMRLWEVLGVPFGPVAATETGYRVERRSGRERPRLQEGLIAERLVDDAVVGELWLVQIAAGASGDHQVFPVKAPEVATVVRGVLDLHVGGRTETLHEGDALVATDATISGWANPGPVATELVWLLTSRPEPRTG